MWKGLVRAARAVVGKTSSDGGPRSGSLAFRRNRAAIERGDVPEKYTRIVTHVPGQKILEIGAAEGVLALLLARDKERVYALERNERRHTEALRLQALWRERGLPVDRCEMIRADLRERIDLLDLVDTVVAVRSIYYLEEDIVPVFEQIARKVPNVLLCGNADRARYFELTGGKGPPRKGFGPYDRYAGFEGMASLLEGVGYRIVDSVKEGDAIVVGHKDVP